MKIIRKIWDFYSVKLILAMGITVLFSLAFKCYPLSGGFLFASTIYFLIRSFRDPAFKRKKVATKVVIYIFMAYFLVCGFIVMFGASDSVSGSIRGQLNSSAVSSR